MIIDLGNHTIECDFDPRIQCNNSAEKLPIEKWENFEEENGGDFVIDSVLEDE